MADRPELLVILLQPLVKEPVVVRAAAPALEEPLACEGRAASDDDHEGRHPDLGLCTTHVSTTFVNWASSLKHPGVGGWGV